MDGLASYPHLSVNDDLLQVENLLEYSANEGDFSGLRKLQIRKLLVSEDLRVAGIVVSFDMPIGQKGIVQNIPTDFQHVTVRKWKCKRYDEYEIDVEVGAKSIWKPFRKKERDR